MDSLLIGGPVSGWYEEDIAPIEFQAPVNPTQNALYEPDGMNAVFVVYLYVGEVDVPMLGWEPF